MKPLQFIILSYVNMGVLIAVFIYGIVTVLTKKTASYFKFYVCAVGSYSIAELLRFAYYLCYTEQVGIAGMFSLGYFGCFLFLLSACRKPFDSIVDDGKREKLKYRIIPIISPIFFTLLTGMSYLPRWEEISKTGFLIVAVMNIPKIICSYYNFKHLILPDDGCGFLRGARYCNMFALLFYFTDSVYTYAAVAGNKEWLLVLGALFNVCCICLTLAAKWGMKQWKIKAF